MNIFLTGYIEELIAEKVRSGRYRSAGEVIVEALRLLDHRDRAATERPVKAPDEVVPGVESAHSEPGTAEASGT